MPVTWSIVAVAALLTHFGFGEGKITIEGRSWRFPVPPYCMRIASAPRSATYVCIGSPDLRALLEQRASQYGWIYREQMGAGHILRSQDQWLTVTARKWASVFTSVRFDLPSA